MYRPSLGHSALKPRACSKWLGRTAFAIYLVMLSAWVANLATGLNPRFQNLPESVDSQAAILERRMFVFDDQPVDYPVWRNRVIIPLAIEGIAKATSLTPARAYLLTRLVTAIIGLTAFSWLVRRHLKADGWFVALAAGLFALALGPTFLHIYDIPSDFLDAAAMCALTLFALEKKRVAFASVLFLALLNREGAIFSVLLWAALHALPLRRIDTVKHLVFCGVTGGAGTALVSGLRWWNAIPAAPADAAVQPIMPMQVHAEQLWHGLTHPHSGNPFYFLIGFILLFALLLRAGWSDLNSLEKRIAGVACIVAIISGAFSNLVELRTQMAALVWFTFLSVVMAHRRLFPTSKQPGDPAHLHPPIA